MADEIKTLIVDFSDGKAQELTDVLKREFPIQECDYTNTMHRTVQSHLEQAYDLCIVSEEFPDEEVEELFRDMKKPEAKAKECVFVKVCSEIPEGFDRSSLNAMGFATVISRKGSYEDIQSLTECLKSKLHVFEVKRRVIDVEGAMDLLFKELDEVAADKKRGVERKFNTVAPEFMELQAEFDDEILSKYFDTLVDQSEEREAPIIARKLNVPLHVLQRDLPHLSSGTYTGASRRVWKKLTEMHGTEEIEVNEALINGTDSGSDLCPESNPDIEASESENESESVEEESNPVT